MSETIRHSELRDSHAEIMRRVADGESFTVTVHGRVVADLVPHQRERTARLRPAPAKAVDELFEAAGPGPDPDQWVRDMAESDRHFRDGWPVDPWEQRPQQ